MLIFARKGLIYFLKYDNSLYQGATVFWKQDVISIYILHDTIVVPPVRHQKCHCTYERLHNMWEFLHEGLPHPYNREQVAEIKTAISPNFWTNACKSKMNVKQGTF